jgi:hypothetical protein
MFSNVGSSIKSVNTPCVSKSEYIQCAVQLHTIPYRESQWPCHTHYVSIVDQDLVRVQIDLVADTVEVFAKPCPFSVGVPSPDHKRTSHPPLLPPLRAFYNIHTYR